MSNDELNDKDDVISDDEDVDGDLSQQLFDAISRSDIELMEMCIYRGASLNNTSTSLHHAGYGPLHLAVSVGDSDMVKKGAWPDLRDKYAETPLHLAAQFGRTDVMRLLLDAGSSLIVRDTHNETALHRAARSGNPSAVCLLMIRGAETEVMNTDGKLPRNLSSTSDIASVFAKDAIGRQILQDCRDDEDQYIIAKEREEMRRESEQQRAKAMERDKRLADEAERINSEYYRRKQNQRIIKQSEKLGGVAAIDADNGLSDDDVHDPVVLACLIGDVDLVLDLVENGADLTRVNDKGRTALDECVASGGVKSREIIKLLIDLEPSLLHHQLHGRTLLHVLAGSGGNGVWSSREALKRTYNSMKTGRMSLDIKLTAQQILQQLHPSFWTTLAVEQRMLDVAKLLIEKFKVSSTTRDDAGLLPNAVAHRTGHNKMGEYLAGVCFLRRLDESAYDDETAEVTPFVGIGRKGNIVTLSWNQKFESADITPEHDSVPTPSSVDAAT